MSTEALSGFVWANRYALHFLDSHLRRSDHGAQFLATSAELQGAPAGPSRDRANAVMVLVDSDRSAGRYRRSEESVRI